MAEYVVCIRLPPADSRHNTTYPECAESLFLRQVPFKERHGDIDLLVDHFIKTACDDFQKTIRGVSSDFISCLEAYSWPGNVRELKNIIQRAVITCPGDILEIGQLPKRVTHFQTKDITMNVRIGMSIAEVEKELLIPTLKHTGHNRTQASQILGISRRSLYNKIERYQL